MHIGIETVIKIISLAWNYLAATFTIEDMIDSSKHVKENMERQHNIIFHDAILKHLHRSLLARYSNVR